MPALNASFNLFNATAVNGNFTSLSLPELASGQSWDTTQLYSHGIIMAVPEPGALALLALAGLLVLSRRLMGQRAGKPLP